jgi:hypothetical protein
MKIEIAELGQIESFYNGMTESYDSSLNERDEVVKECELCDGKGFDETISDCCGATREPDLGMCYECHDHCDPSPCPDCNGTGIIK